MIKGFFRLPAAMRLLYSDAVYRRHSNTEKTVYLTFDDGPTENGTRSIINVLLNNDVREATFFCTGQHITDYPHSAAMIREQGYSLANHGYLHLDGWKSSKAVYLDNCLKGSELSGSSFFRPPYGHLTVSQYLDLKKYVNIVFWDLLLYDFDYRFKSEFIIRKAERLVRPGSVIVLHDSEDECSLRVLSSIIGICRAKGYVFGEIRG